MELEAGVSKHKGATIAEAEMLAAGRPTCSGVSAGRPQLPAAWPGCASYIPALPILRDRRHDRGSASLSEAMARKATVDVLLDLDVGQHRTGIRRPASRCLYVVARFPGLRPGGLHVYDGHNHQESLADRERPPCRPCCRRCWNARRVEAPGRAGAAAGGRRHADVPHNVCVFL